MLDDNGHVGVTNTCPHLYGALSSRICLREHSPNHSSPLFVYKRREEFPTSVCYRTGRSRLMSDALRRDYRVREEIGRGRFGVVFRCSSVISGHSFAVKSLDKRIVSAGDSLDAQCLSTEPKILQVLSPHPYILSLYDFYEDDSHLHMVVDLCSTSDLFHRVSLRLVSEAFAASVMSQLMQAVSHCHRLGIAHRDIKPDNILFDERDDVKLADFGSAEFFEQDQESMSGIVGTPYYVAPEVLSGRNYGEKVDVWSAGVVLYVMLAGFPPFYGDSAVEIFQAVLRANLRFPPRVFHSVSPAAKDLLRKMLCKDVSKRFSADQVLRHPWITSCGGPDFQWSEFSDDHKKGNILESSFLQSNRLMAN